MLEPVIALVAIAGAVLHVLATVHVDRPTWRDMGVASHAILTGSLIVLSLLWHGRVGWLSTPYALLALLAACLDMFGAVLLLQPLAADTDYFAFLMHLCAALAFTLALWTPSVPVTYINDVTVDLAWRAESHKSARVPLHALRLLPALPVVVGLVLVWHETSWMAAAKTAYVPAVSFAAVQT